MFLREWNDLVGKSFIVRVLGHLGSKQQSVGFRVDRQEREIEERVQIGSEQESVFDVVVFGATVRVDMGGFEDLFDLATRDNASAIEVRKQCGAKGSLATTQFDRLQGAGSFVLIVGLKRLIGFGIRDAVDIQGDKFVDGLGEFGMLLEVSEFQFDDVLGFEELDGGDIEEVFGEIDGCIE